MNTVELGIKIANFISEHGDEYEIKDQMNSDETRDEYIDRLENEIAVALETSNGAANIFAYLDDFLETPETEQEAKQLMDEIWETYAFQLGNIARKFTAVECAAENLCGIDDMKAEAAEMGISELSEFNEQLLDTPEGRADMLQKSQEFEKLLKSNPENFDERISEIITHLHDDISSLGEETELQYIARKASQLIYEPTDFFEAVINDFDNADIRNKLVAKLETVAGYEVASSASFSSSRLIHDDSDNAETAAKLISRICKLENGEIDKDPPKGKDRNMKAIIHNAMYADSQERTYYAVRQYEAIKNIVQDGDTACEIKLFSAHSQFADIHVNKDKASVKFLDDNFLDNKDIAEAANEIGKYLKEPLFHTEYHYPQNYKHVTIETFVPCHDKEFAAAKMDDSSLAECLDRTLISLATTDNDFIFYEGADFIKDHDVDVLVDVSTEQLYIGFADNGKRYEHEIPLTPDERSVVTERLDEYEDRENREGKENFREI